MMDTIILKHPASFFSQPWREATPLGNGLTGALIYGGIATETIILNRYDLWHMEKLCDIPDVSADFEHMRRVMDEKQYISAKSILQKALKRENYNPEPGYPFPLGALKISMKPVGMFENYRRVLYMDRGEYRTDYDEDGSHICESCFISRENDVLFYKIVSESDKNYEITFGLHDDGTNLTTCKKAEVEPNSLLKTDGGYIYFIAENQGLKYGAVIKVIGGTSGEKSICFFGKKLEMTVKCFSGCEELTPEEMRRAIDTAGGYDSEIEKHIEKHKALYKSAELSLHSGEEHSNEDLLAEAYSSAASPELIEKLWKFGRYLFVSGTNEKGYPFPLYGLWHGEYMPSWAQNVANENVQMLYWHCLTGNLYSLMKPLITYYTKSMDLFRECAAKFFGCGGIYISVYSSPVNMQPSPTVPVIINYISVAGWLANLFYKYYKITKDKETLCKHILPFMTEAAEFYCDYVTIKDGKAEIYPSVSPENSPRNYIKNECMIKMTHPMPVARNATMDFAIMKELFNNLTELSAEYRIERARLDKWKAILEIIPPYMVNEDGAIKEWMSDEFEDNYFHRHLSHIYPLFPGSEISESDPLIKNFEKAVDMRVLQGQSGWSLMHIAGIYTCLARAEDAIKCIDILCKGCLLNNMMSMHNDYRDMGVTLDLGQFAPIQLDADMGAVNVIQLMIFSEKNGCLNILPSLPKRLKKGMVKNFAFYGGSVNITWDASMLEVRIFAKEKIKTKIKLPEGQYMIKSETEESRYSADKEYILEKDHILTICGNRSES